MGDAARERGGKVRSFRVRVGELAQFDLGLIKELLAELSRGTDLEGATAVVQEEKSMVRCESCKSEWLFGDLVGALPDDEKEVIHFLPELLATYCRCPSCSRGYFKILEGRSVRVEEVVLDV